MQRMRDILRAELGRSLRDLSEEDRLAASWPVACGAALASHGEVLHLDADRVLHIRVQGREWFDQFLHIRSTLAADLARIARVPLHGIHFEEQGRAPLRPAPKLSKD
ncbi:MAG: DUF721 domain-containing protein [Acidobacteriota bacterium]